MKLLFISGAYKNSGDFLILERSIKLVKSFFAQCETDIIMANNSLDDKLEYINTFDWIIFPGGPGYLYNYYPNFVALTKNLDDLKCRMISFGMGWYGTDTSEQTIYNYDFSADTTKLFNRILKDSNFLGCRDNYSVRVLKNNGFDNTVMMGCPAWYDIENVDKLDLRDGINFDFKKICISDPANIFENAKQCLELLKYLKQKFPNSDIQFVFHRGTNEDGFTDPFTGKLTLDLKNKIEAIGIRCKDIAYGSEGFSIYDDVDLHIGYRVHSHIYNLSKRNLSILIEEDGRGAGVNEALGLFRLKAYSFKKKYKHNILIRGYRKAAKMIGINSVEKSNKYLIKILDDYLYILKESNYQVYRNAFGQMNHYYEIMKEAILEMDKI